MDLVDDMQKPYVDFGKMIYCSRSLISSSVTLVLGTFSGDTDDK